MHIPLLIPEYFVWHYTTALRQFLNILTNFLWFTYNFFSIPLLAKTLFSPWHRIHENYKGGLNASSFFETLTVNTIMRLVGLVVRLVVIAFGIVLCAVVLIIGIALFIAWLVLPFLVVVLVIEAFRFLLT